MRPVLCNMIFCDRITAGKGKYNLEGVFFRIHAMSYPCSHKCFVVVGWYGDSGSHSFSLSFLDPGRSRTLFEVQPHPFRLSASAPYFNAVIEVVLPLTGQGSYWFDVYLNGDFIESFPIHIITVPGSMPYGN